MSSSNRLSGTSSTSVSVANGGSMRSAESVRPLIRLACMSECCCAAKNDGHTARQQCLHLEHQLLHVDDRRREGRAQPVPAIHEPSRATPHGTVADGSNRQAAPNTARRQGGVISAHGSFDLVAAFLGRHQSGTYALKAD